MGNSSTSEELTIDKWKQINKYEKYKNALTYLKKASDSLYECNLLDCSCEIEQIIEIVEKCMPENLEKD